MADDDVQVPVDEDDDALEYKERGGQLLSWIMARVEPWRNLRDNKHRDQWDEYASIWRGEYTESGDKKRKSERSKIVTPATMQAVDSTVAEIEEAVFGREAWFDMDEDAVEGDGQEAWNQRQEIIGARDLLRERLDEEGVPQALGQIFLLGAVYGTGIGKVNVYPKVTKEIVDGEVRQAEAARVELIPLEPYEFVPDPTTDKIEDMLGMAHDTILPLHKIKEGMRDGLYRECHLTEWTPGGKDPLNKDRRLFQYEAAPAEGVKITEWHGRVPAAYLASYMDERAEMLAEGAEPDESLVEAIVTIANDSKIIAAKPNPFTMEDRAFIAYQHDTIPGYFWGRGVVEKAYNSQKALDADVRMRIDAMALVANPMVAGDITRLPRGMNLAVWPGKFWPTTGSPNEVLQPFQFGQLNPNLFQSAADMERMVQTATGAMDPSAGYGSEVGAQARALSSSAFIKRARRTMQNIERNLLQPLVRKAMWRYIQFSPTEFPEDYKFTVRGTLGVMAREIEQQQITQLLSLVPNESRPFMVLVKSAFDNTSSPHKKEVLAAIDQMVNPPPPSEEEAQMQKMMQELQMRGQVAAVEEVEAKAAKAKAEAERASAQAQSYLVEADFRDEEIQQKHLDSAINLREVQAFEMQNQVSSMMQQLRAFDLALKAQLQQAQIGKINAEAIQIQKGTKAD
jgi:hypothetical protein